MATAGDAGPVQDGDLKMSEIEFLAESELVEILPNFEAEALQFIGGPVGPFRPQRPIEVPIWLAVTLRGRKKCTIKPPDWMNKDTLRELCEEEKKSELFIEMPRHFQEIAALLFECASSDIRDSEQVRALLADIHDTRYSKVRSGILKAKEGVVVRVNHLTMLEMNASRPFWLKSMDTLRRLNETLDAAENDEQ